MAIDMRKFQKPDDDEFKKGDKVRYRDALGRTEKGIVKSLTRDGEAVFVVYHCDGRWDDFENFTAARTSKEDLLHGWN